MKKICFVVSLLLLQAFTYGGTGQKPVPLPAIVCSSDDVNEFLLNRDPAFRSNHEAIEREIHDYILNESLRNQNGQTQPSPEQAVVYTIPVVVHIIHLGEAIGTGTNISNAQILGAIDGLNQRFRNNFGNGNDVEIQFCLASKDPSGNATAGINRVNGTAVTNYSAEGIDVSSSCPGSANEVSIKNLIRWPNTDYYNIWIVKSVCNGNWGGFAYYPGASSTYDGAVIAYNQFGFNDHSTAHELGHGFNLYHTFNGDNDNTTCPTNGNCLTDGDRCCDTPPHKQGDCGSSNPCTVSGVWDNSHYNYMSYCYYGWSSPNLNAGRFTEDQITRMRATLSVSPRSSLLLSNGCSSGCLQPANDLCADAIPLTVGSSCAYTSGTTCGATAISPTTGMGTCILGPGSAEDVWYSFEATQTSATINVSSGANFDAIFQLFSDVTCSSSYNQLACVNNTGTAAIETLSVINLTIGETYWIRVYNNSGLIGTDFQICVKDCSAPAQPGSISGPTNPCQNSSATYSITAVSGATSYNWTATNGTVSGSGTSVSVSWGSTATGSVQVAAVGICTNSSAANLNVNLSSAPNQPGSISGNISPCASSSATYSITAVSGATSYNWSATNGTVTGSGTSVSVSWGTGTSGSLQVSAQNNCGTSSNASMNVTLNNVAAVPGTISGDANPCVSSINSYTITAVAGATSYNWSAANGTVFGTGTSVSVTWGTGTSGTISVSSQNSCGTSALSTLNVSLGNAPAQPGSITGSASLCAGASSTYSIAAVAGATSYNWSATNGTVTGSGTSVSIVWGTGTSGSIDVSATNTCGTGANASLSVTLNNAPPQPGSISGNSGPCAGTTNTYSISSVSGANSYNWSASNGTVTGSGTSVSINWGTGSSGTVQVSSQGTCGTSAVRTLNVTLNNIPAQPSSISGSTSLCEGATATYTIAGVSGATSYSWSATNGTVSGSGTSVSVTWGTTTSGSLRVASVGSCGTSSNRTLNVTLNHEPDLPGVIAGETMPCFGSIETYSISSVSGATSYNWSVNNGTLSGSGTSVTVHWGTSGSGLVRVSAQNSCGSSANSTLNVNITNTPNQTGVISGDSVPCTGSTSTYSINPVSGASSYNWIATNGTVSGSGISVDVTWGNGSNGGLQVSALGSCGISPSSSMNISLLNTPNTPGQITGDTSICAGSTEIYSISPVTGANSYDWIASTGTITGSGTTVSVSWGSGTPVSLHVASENACGLSAGSSLFLTLNLVPEIPAAISGETNPCENDTITYSINPVSGATSYYWILGSAQLISGGTGTTSTLYWPSPGNTQIQVAAVNSCGQGPLQNVSINISPALNCITGFKNTTSETDFNLFPNPVHETLYLSGTGLENGNYETSLINVLGEKISQMNFVVSDGKVDSKMDLSKLASGIYYLIINSNKQQSSYKIRKM